MRNAGHSQPPVNLGDRITPAFLAAAALVGAGIVLVNAPAR